MAALQDILGTGTAGAVRRPMAARAVLSAASISPDVAGAPATVPGGNDGKDKTKMTGTPVAQARVSPGIDSGIAGAPMAGTAVTNVNTTTSTAGNETSAGKHPRLSYVELYETLNPNKPETPEQRTRREKRENRERIFSALGDGISAMSNLYFTTQYAPNAYDHTQGMSERTRARFEKLRAERQANEKAYNDGYLRAVMLDREAEDKDKAWRRQLERDAAGDKRADAAEKRAEQKAEQNELMFQLKYALQQGKLTEQGYRNAIAEVKAGKIGELTDAQISRYNRMSRGGGGGVSSAAKRYAVFDENGNIVDHVYTKEEAVMRSEIDYPAVESESTSNSTKNRRTGETTRKTSGKKSMKKPETKSAKSKVSIHN